MEVRLPRTARSRPQGLAGPPDAVAGAPALHPARRPLRAGRTRVGRLRPLVHRSPVRVRARAGVRGTTLDDLSGIPAAAETGQLFPRSRAGEIAGGRRRERLVASMSAVGP